MASGGYQPSKQGRSESQRQTNWQRSFSSDRDDAHSLNSLPGDMRINNWDLSDLHPSNLGANSKRHKKSKGNPEREREQSLSVDSPPNEKKNHTPSSYPRTKITANTTTSQRVALENIRLHMTFSEEEDEQANVDGERNNERQVRHKQQSLPNGSLNRAHSDDSIRAASLGLLSRNNMHRSSKEQGPDRNEIVARLTQIQDFMKQARSMLDSLERLGNKKRTEDVEKVRRLIRNLQEQEHGYLGLLENSTKTSHDEANDNDEEEEETAGDDEDEDEEDDDNDKILEIEAMECSDGNTSADLDVEAEITEASQESRPRIESKLGIESDASGRDPLEMFLGTGRESAEDVNHNGLAEADQAAVLHSRGPVQESQEGARAATGIDGEVMTDTRRDLLQILREKEQQLQALMSRQEELNHLRKEATRKLMEVKAKDNIASTTLSALVESQKFMGSRPQPLQLLEMAIKGAGIGVSEEEEGSGGAAGLDRQLRSNIEAYPESDDEDNSKVLGVEALPNKLLELKQQLNFLKNEFSQISEDPNMETDPCVLVEGPQQLQNKLHELQNKKLQLDMRLQELQMIHSPPGDNSKNNETNAPTNGIHPVGPIVSHVPAIQQQQTANKPAPSSGPSSVSQPTNLQMQQANALASFAGMAGWSEFGQDAGAHMMQELQEKLRCLNEVREQLNQLKSSVQLNETEHPDLVAVANGDGRQPVAGREHGGDASLLTTASTLAPSSSFQVQEKGQSQSQKQQRLKQRPQQQQPKQQQQKPLRSQPKLKSPGNRYAQQQDEILAAASSRNMTQLLNLEGTDPGDEHSDEDNVSASKSGSAWSVLESWDHDPEVQEKVRKLKSAKENLQRLQDLVSFVQQSPDGVGGVPREQAGKATGADDSQTYDLNVSVSEGELPSESVKIPQRDNGGGEEEDPVAELEKLRKERYLLMDLQNQLQRIQNQTPGSNTGEVRVRTRPDSGKEKSRLEQVSSTPVVTFASNDELYSKIRRQRILHEELRSKKRELEAIMKKDHNRRQYSRNQDNQSDSVSLTTDMFGAAASVDATMATWGGSTADNRENVTDDEDEQDRDSSNHGEEDHENEDVGNPSRNRSNSRNVQLRQSLSSREENQRRSRDRQQQEDDDDDDGFPSPNVDWYRNIESRLSGLTTAVETLLKKSENEGRPLHVSVGHESLPHSSAGPFRPDQQQQQLLQLQNQSLMLSFSQLVQTLTRQQGEIQHLQQQVQALQLQIQAVSFEHMTPAVTVNLPMPSPFRQSQPSPVVSTCSSRPRPPAAAAAAMGVHPVVIKHQQKPHLHSQRNVTNTDLFVDHSEANPGFASIQSGNLSARHLSPGAGKTPADGACSNLETSQPKSLFQQGPTTRKSGTQVMKLYSDSTSSMLPVGVRMSAARSENLGEERRRVYPGKTDDGRASSRAPAVGKAGARMDDFDQDGSNYSSSQSVSSQCSGLRQRQATARPGDSGAAVANSSTLFDTLRDTIYTEVASLISQNENRPYFLLELFRDMQRVDSDAMRQQALSSLQELVSLGRRNDLTAWSSAPTWSQCTQTQSESLSTGLIAGKNSALESASDEEEDDDDDLLEARLQEEIIERNQLERVIRNGTFQSAPFDYAELVDNPSSLSTPPNGDDESLTFQRYQPPQDMSRHGRATRNSKESIEKRTSVSESRKGQLAAETKTSESEHDDDAGVSEQSFGDVGVSEQTLGDVGVSEQSYTVQLAQCETKPFTRIGSDEDDDEGDQVWSMNDPSETAVSRDTRLENGSSQYPLVHPPPTRPEAEGAREDGAEKQNLGQPTSPRPTSSREDKVDGSSGGTYTVPHVSQVNGSPTDHTFSSSNEEQTQASSGEKSAQPAALPDSATHSDSVEINGRYLEEQTTLNGLDAVLASLGGMEELAGDEASVLGPESFLNLAILPANDQKLG